MLAEGSALLLAHRIFLDRVYREPSLIEGNPPSAFQVVMSMKATKLGLNAGALLLIGTSIAIANRYVNSNSATVASNVTFAISNVQVTRGLFEHVDTRRFQAVVIMSQLIGAFALEQLANGVLPGKELEDGWRSYMGPMTCIALATAATFITTMFVNRIWSNEYSN